MRKIFATLVVVASLTTGALAQPPGEEQPPVPVMTARAEKGAFVQGIRLTGTVVPFRASELAAEFDGVVEEVLVEEGDKVTQGTPLIRIRSVPFELEYEQADARARAAEAQLAELEAGSRPEEVTMASGRLAESKAMLANAERDYLRQEQLLGEKSASEQDYENARQRYQTMQALVRISEANNEMVVNGPRSEAIEFARGQAAAARAQARLAKDNLERATVRAPYDGAVTRRLVDPGSWVGKGDTVVHFQDASKVYVRINAPEGFYNRISLGDSTEFSFDAAPNQTFRGTLDQIIPRSDPTSRAFPVKLIVDNSEGHLAPGMLARGTIEPPGSGQSVIVPKDALVARGPKPTVFRVKQADGKPTAEGVEVETGRYFGTAVEVYGLEPNDEVVVRGNERLMDGAVLLLNQFITNPDTTRVN